MNHDTLPADWLVQTKLHPPRLREDVIPRPCLLATLRDGLTLCRLTLLSAPAGYGKTTLLAAAIKNLPVAWLTLDEGDNDPTLFLAYLVAALQRLNPACGATAQTVLATLTNPAAQARQIIGALINDVLETLPAPFVLILDDVHLITEPAVHVALDYLLERLPPQMHLAVGTRHDPPLALARLRARGQLAELGLADLRFTLDETTRFLNERLQLGLPPDDLAVLHHRTEGWPAGLRLLASSLARIPTPAGRTAFITDLAQTDRYVFDFLAEEVLNRQSEAVRAFLLETSILSELTPSLCRAVTGRDDADGLLEELDRRKLFVVNVQHPISNLQYPIYRYHALFAEFLRQRLAQEMPERVRDLHRRAAETQADPHRAVRHCLAAEMWEEAARTVERIGEEVVKRGLLDTLTGWIHSLPAPIREERPRLIYLLGVCAWQRGETIAAQTLLREAIRQFKAAGDEAGQVQAMIHLLPPLSMAADFRGVHEVTQQVLGLPAPAPYRVQVLMVRGIAALSVDDWQGAANDLKASLAIAEEADDPDTWGAQVVHCLNPFITVPGGLDQVERICYRAMAYAGGQISVVGMAVATRYAYVRLLRGRLEEALQSAERALAIGEQLGGVPYLGGEAAIALGQTHLALGDYVTASQALVVAHDCFREFPHGQAAIAMTLYPLGLVRWQQGEIDALRQVYAQMVAAEFPGELHLAPVLRATLRGVIEIAQRHYAEAERRLRQAVALQEGSPTSMQLGSARLLLAHLYTAWNRPDEALAELAPVLAACEQARAPGRVLQEGAHVVPALRLAVERGVHAPFAAHLLDLLGAGAEPRPVHIPETGETLTPREVEVLRLITAGASNREIAEQLVIGQTTVKTHVSRILRKLHVSSRTEAAARARDLRLI